MSVTLLCSSFTMGEKKQRPSEKLVKNFKGQLRSCLKNERISKEKSRVKYGLMASLPHGASNRFEAKDGDHCNICWAFPGSKLYLFPQIMHLCLVKTVSRVFLSSQKSGPSQPLVRNMNLDKLNRWEPRGNILSSRHLAFQCLHSWFLCVVWIQ